MSCFQTVCTCHLINVYHWLSSSIKRTDGNALFAHQLLRSLEADGLLTFDQNDRTWRWDFGRAQPADPAQRMSST